MDAASQAMIDGIAPYAGDPMIEARCVAAVVQIDAAIDLVLHDPPVLSLDDAQHRAGMPLEPSEGQPAAGDFRWPECPPRCDCRDRLDAVASPRASCPGQSRRDRTATGGRGPCPLDVPAAVGDGVRFAPGDRVFLMFGAGNREARVLDRPGRGDITRDTRASLVFGARRHFCAGAAASRALIGEVALPMLFDALPTLRLDGPAPFAGWAFCGPVSMPVARQGLAARVPCPISSLC